MFSESPETIATHESFADLTVIFSLLSQLDICELAMSETKGELHRDSFLSGVAEEFGKTMMKSGCLRNANNGLRLDQVGREPHELSQVLTGAIYDILATFLDGIFFFFLFLNSILFFSRSS